jgi:hypothetical protein
MRFSAEHRFEGSAAAVGEVLSDAGFYSTLDLPDLARPVLLESSRDGDKTRLVFRYEFVGSLDPLARRLLGSHRLAWRQQIEVDHTSESGDLSFAAEADPKRLHGSADFVLTADQQWVTRRLSGELVVAVPLIGATAERKIVPGLLRRLDIEAEAVQQRLRGNPE